MAGLVGNSEFYFPETSLEVPRGKAESNTVLRVEGNQNSPFPEEPVIKCFVILPNSKLEKKKRKNDLFDALSTVIAPAYEQESKPFVLPKRHDNSLFLRS